MLQTPAIHGMTPKKRPLLSLDHPQNSLLCTAPPVPQSTIPSPHKRQKLNQQPFDPSASSNNDMDHSLDGIDTTPPKTSQKLSSTITSRPLLPPLSTHPSDQFLLPSTAQSTHQPLSFPQPHPPRRGRVVTPSCAPPPDYPTLQPPPPLPRRQSLTPTPLLHIASQDALYKRYCFERFTEQGQSATTIITSALNKSREYNYNFAAFPVEQSRLTQTHHLFLQAHPTFPQDLFDIRNYRYVITNNIYKCKLCTTAPHQQQSVHLFESLLSAEKHRLSYHPQLLFEMVFHCREHYHSRKNNDYMYYIQHEYEHHRLHYCPIDNCPHHHKNATTPGNFLAIRQLQQQHQQQSSLIIQKTQKNICSQIPHPSAHTQGCSSSDDLHPQPLADVPSITSNIVTTTAPKRVRGRVAPTHTPPPGLLTPTELHHHMVSVHNVPLLPLPVSNTITRDPTALRILELKHYFDHYIFAQWNFYEKHYRPSAGNVQNTTQITQHQRPLIPGLSSPYIIVQRSRGNSPPRMIVPHATVVNYGIASNPNTSALINQDAQNMHSIQQSQFHENNNNKHQALLHPHSSTPEHPSHTDVSLLGSSALFQQPIREEPSSLLSNPPPKRRQRNSNRTRVGKFDESNFEQLLFELENQPDHVLVTTDDECMAENNIHESSPDSFDDDGDSNSDGDNNSDDDGDSDGDPHNNSDLNNTSTSDSDCLLFDDLESDILSLSTTTSNSTLTLQMADYDVDYAPIQNATINVSTCRIFSDIGTQDDGINKKLNENTFIQDNNQHNLTPQTSSNYIPFVHPYVVHLQSDLDHIIAENRAKSSKRGRKPTKGNTTSPLMRPWDGHALPCYSPHEPLQDGDHSDGSDVCSMPYSQNLNKNRTSQSPHGKSRNTKSLYNVHMKMFQMQRELQEFQQRHVEELARLQTQVLGAVRTHKYAAQSRVKLSELSCHDHHRRK